MAPPAVTARNLRVPAGRRFENGHPIRVVFSLNPEISIWERSVTLPGLDQGDMIDTSTQFNDSLRQMAFRALATLTESSMEVGFNGESLGQILAIRGINAAVTIHLPNLSSISFYGGIRTFEQSAMVDGEFPIATCAIGITNTDPATGDEELPVYTAPP